MAKGITGGTAVEMKCEYCFYQYDNRCRRYPPQVVVDPEDGSAWSVFPEAERSSFCGEFKIREKK